MWSACFIGRAHIWDASAVEIPVPKGLEQGGIRQAAFPILFL
ncbi:hypothetical protein B4135_2288 [Caldibacillus debilis]|jgi:hypothetical protein|nr:hypothetical protein B4135_2288 [Caldibacillus debilis]